MLTAIIVVLSSIGCSLPQTKANKENCATKIANSSELAALGIRDSNVLSQVPLELLEPLDLIKHMRAGVQHIYAGLDRRRAYWPYFSWVHLGVHDDIGLNPLGTTDPIPYARHTIADTPHVTGRFLDALARCNAIAQMPRDDLADKALAALLYTSFREDDLPYDSVNTNADDLARMHNNREVLFFDLEGVRIAPSLKCYE